MSHGDSVPRDLLNGEGSLTVHINTTSGEVRRGTGLRDRVRFRS